MKKLILFALIASLAIPSFAQDSTANRQGSKNDRREEHRQKINAMIKQSEEGALIYSKQSIFGLQLRTNGYGLYYEMGRMKTARKTNIYRIDITEIKALKEDKLPSGGFFFGNPYIYGKVNNFYQVTLGFGQQYILGQKGNKNGVSVSAVYNAGLSLGLLRPYYVQVLDQNGTSETIKYTPQDSALFLGPTIIGGGGFSKGWSEIKMKPGVYAKAALRFDFGRFNETVSGIEAGMSAEAYSNTIPILLMQKDKRIFFQGYVALCFGRRKQ